MRCVPSSRGMRFGQRINGLDDFGREALVALLVALAVIAVRFRL